GTGGAEREHGLAFQVERQDFPWAEREIGGQSSSPQRVDGVAATPPRVGRHGSAPCARAVGGSWTGPPRGGGAPAGGRTRVVAPLGWGGLASLSTPFLAGSMSCNTRRKCSTAGSEGGEARGAVG